MDEIATNPLFFERLDLSLTATAVPGFNDESSASAYKINIKDDLGK